MFSDSCETFGESAAVASAAAGRYSFLAVRNKSPEHRAKVSAAKRGHVVSAETRAKISAARMGQSHPQSAETRAKISAAKKGRARSEEHGRALGASLSRSAKAAAHRERIVAAQRGVPLSAEHRAKVGAGGVGRVKSEAERKKLSVSLRGLKRTPEQRRRISESRKAIYANETKADRLVRLAAWMAAGKKAAMRANPSNLERSVGALLSRLGIEHEPQKPILRYVADFYVPSRNLIIECDGEYWHRNKQDYDRRRDADIRALGYDILRLPGKVIESGQAEARILARVA
jgi:very-short-patch-repair endonuclease